MMQCYQAFQLTILSDLEFPELLPSQDVKVDVMINFGFVSPEGLDQPLKKGAFFQAKKDMFWLQIPKIARFLVSNGQKITIDPIAGVEEDSLRVFLLGSCFGALLMQRGLFLLHGNAVKIQQHAISFVGSSGVGKSTLSAVFSKRGYSILADDVCAINAQGEVLPSFPQIKLWADVAKKLSIDTKNLRKIRPNIEKYAFPLDINFYNTPLPLKGVYILSSHNKDEISIKQVVGVNKFQPLRSQCYRLPYVQGLSQGRQHKLTCGQLASRVLLAQVARPNSGYHLESLADNLEYDLARQGLEHG